MPSRNDPCSCGSGKKYKVCCAGKRPPAQWFALLGVAVFVGLAAWIVTSVVRQVSSDDGAAQSGRVWSAEHGHWHEDQNPGAAPPTGPAPPGKVWSVEHGHWHDAQVEGIPAPQGPPPPGKVWSAEHGHWHDASPGPGGEEPTTVEVEPPAAEPLPPDGAGVSPVDVE
jgi:hypothetical protein